MGNIFTKRRTVVNEKYTQPQGLYEHIGLDTRKLRRLIINGQLAPCFPGVEDPSAELEECPICFLSYPSLNRSKCCTKAICTECFLQIKTLHPARSARSAQCPFCKLTNYGVEYRGAKSLEEKGMEQAEEQKVIEAKIRIRQKEILEHEEERMLSRVKNLQNGDGEDAEAKPVGDRQCSFALIDVVPISESQDFLTGRDTRSDLQSETVIPGCATESHVSSAYHSNRANFDFDLEDVMVMEAIWLSIQDHEQSQQAAFLGPQIQGVGHPSNKSSNFSNGNTSSTPATTSTGVTGSLAGAIAVLAENQVSRFESNLGISQVCDTCNISICGQINSIFAGPRSAEISTMSISNQMNDVIANEANAELSPIRVPRSITRNIRKESRVQSNADCENNYEEREHNLAKLAIGQVPNNQIELAVGREDSKGSVAGWSRTLIPLLQRYSKVSASRSHSCEATQVEEMNDQPSSSTSLPSMVPDNFDEQIMLALALSLADAQNK